MMPSTASQPSTRAKPRLLLRFFGGLSEEETAEVLQISAKTVQRDWNKAKAWLYYELSNLDWASFPNAFVWNSSLIPYNRRTNNRSN